MSRWLLSLALVFGLGACSGDAGEGICPAGPPVAGETCFALGLSCDYAGSPCGVSAECVGGRWETNTTCPPAPECPEQAPGDGQPCELSNPVAGPLTCTYGACPEGTLGGPELRAECQGQQWEVTPIACREAVLCGECPEGRNCDIHCDPATSELPCASNHCEAGNLCLHMPLNASEWIWDCAINQCEPDPVECSCVGEVCGQRGYPGDWVCVATEDIVVSCECQGPECA